MKAEIIKVEHNTEQWLELRKQGLGGSDAGSACGVNPYKTNIDLYNEKLGLVEAPNLDDNASVQYGKQAEEHLAKLFELDFPQYQVRVPKDYIYKLGFMTASLDMELVDKETGELGFGEIKTTKIFSEQGLKKWEGQIPQHYYCQILHYFIVTGFEFCIVKAQIKLERADGSIELITRHYHFKRSDEQVKADMKWLYLKEKEFWQAVQAKQSPALLLPKI